MPQTDPFEAALAAASPPPAPASDPFEAALAAATPPSPGIYTGALDERGQPLPSTGAVPPGAAEDLEKTIPTVRMRLGEALQTPSAPLLKAVNAIPGNTNPLAPVLKGIGETAVEQMTAGNAMLLPALGTLPETAGRAASGAFGAMALKAMASQAPTAYALWQKGDKAGAVKELTKLGLTSLIAGLGFTHMAAGGSPTGKPMEYIPPPEAPELPVASKVTLTDFQTPEELTAAREAARPAQEAQAAADVEKRKAAFQMLKGNLPEDEDIPEPELENKVEDRLTPTPDERAEITRKAGLTGGTVLPDEVPKSVSQKARIEMAAQDLSEQLAMAAENPPGRVQDQNTLQFSGLKSMVPPEIQDKLGGGQKMLEVLTLGMSDQPMSVPQRRVFDTKIYPYLEKQALRARISVPDLQNYLDSHGIPEKLTPVKEQVDAQKEAIEERAAVAEEPAGEPSFDPLELDNVPPAGVSDVMAAGRDGEPMHPLLPPDRPLRESVNALFQEGNPQKIADTVAKQYGITEPIAVTIDPQSEIPRTELVDGGLKITLPPEYEPYQIVHEVAYEGRKFTGRLVDGMPHDDNQIAAQYLGDRRAMGAVDTQPNGLPTTGFVGMAPNPLAPLAGRTWELDQPMPAAETVESAVPPFKNIFDPGGVIDPQNEMTQRGVNGERLRALDMQINGNIRVADTEMFHKALREYHSDWLRSKGFDAMVWEDELGRHVAEIPKTAPYVAGEAQASPDGEAMQGAPEAARIDIDNQMVREAETRGALPSTDLMMTLPGLPQAMELGRQDIAPAAKKFWDGTKETARMLQKALAPTSLLTDAQADAFFKGKGVGNRAMAEYRMNAAIVKARSMFDQLTRPEQIAFIDAYKQGQTQPTPTVLTESIWKKPVSELGQPRETTDLNELSRMIRAVETGWYDKLADTMDADGKSMPFIENHLALFWEDPPEKVQAALAPAMEAARAQMMSKRPFQGRKGFLQQMVYDTMSDGIAAGLTPVSTNPFVLMELRGADVAKFISAKAIFNNAKAEGSVVFVPAGKEGEFRAARPDWAPINDRSSEVYYPTEIVDPTANPMDPQMAEGRQVMVKAGTWYWEPNIGRVVNNYLSRDLIRQSALGRGLMGMKNYTTSVELAINTFHFGYTNFNSLVQMTSDGLQKIAHGDIPTKLQGGKQVLAGVAGMGAPGFNVLGGGAKYAYEGAKLKRYFTGKGEFLNTPEAQDFAAKNPQLSKALDLLFSAGGSIGSSEDFRQQTARAIGDALDSGNTFGAVLRSAPALLETVNKPLFDHYIPNVKLGAFAQELSTSLMKNADALQRGQVTEETIARQAWARIDNRFGILDFDNLAWDKTMKSTLQLFLRSVTWKLGNLRTAGGAVGGQAAALADAAKYRTMPELDSNFSFVLATLMGVAAASMTWQKMSTAAVDPNGKGVWPWETDTPLTDFVMPRIGGTDRNGNPSRANPPTYLRDWRSMMRPGQYAWHSASAMVGRTYEALQNKDFYGNEVYDPSAPPVAGIPMVSQAYKFAAHIFLPTPIGVQSFSQSTNNEGSGLSMAGSTFGWTPAPASATADPFDTAIADLRKKKGESAPGRNEAQQASHAGQMQIEDAASRGFPSPAAAIEAAGPAKTQKGTAVGNTRAQLGASVANAKAVANVRELAQAINQNPLSVEKMRALLPVLTAKWADGRYLRRLPAAEQEAARAEIAAAFAKLRGW